jgi:hypothetical protein
VSEAIRPAADAVRRAAARVAAALQPHRVIAATTAGGDASGSTARRPLVLRSALLAGAWLLGLGGLALMWHGLPTGGSGSVLWSLTGLAAALGASAVGLSLALPMTHMEVPDRAERIWALLGLFTTVTCAGGALAVLAFDQLGRVWNGLGL